jgi:hypothetical protein
LRSGNSELALIVHLADFVAKKAGFNYEATSSSSEIDPQTLTILGLQKKEINTISAEIVKSVEQLATEFQ